MSIINIKRPNEIYYNFLNSKYPDYTVVIFFSEAPMLHG